MRFEKKDLEASLECCCGGCDGEARFGEEGKSRVGPMPGEAGPDSGRTRMSMLAAAACAVRDGDRGGECGERGDSADRGLSESTVGE